MRFQKATNGVVMSVNEARVIDLSNMPAALASVGSAGHRHAIAMACSRRFIEATRADGGLRSMVGFMLDEETGARVGAIVVSAGNEMHGVLLDPSAPELAAMLKSAERHEELPVMFANEELGTACLYRLVVPRGSLAPVRLNAVCEVTDGDDVKWLFMAAAQVMVSTMHREAKELGLSVEAMTLHVVRTASIAGTADMGKWSTTVLH